MLYLYSFNLKTTSSKVGGIKHKDICGGVHHSEETALVTKWHHEVLPPEDGKWAEDSLTQQKGKVPWAPSFFLGTQGGNVVSLYFLY